MFILLALLVLGGFISALFAGFLYYGVAGLVELFEAGVIVVTVLLYWLYNTFSKTARAEAAKARKELYDTNRRRFESIPITMNDGSIRAHGTFEYDEYGIPILN